MTLIQRSNDTKAENMERSPTKEGGGKSSRPVRSRRYTRRSFGTGQRPPKRLFTPEIKRYLKDWLVRRRDNPYPNREEKLQLADETGLTYIQICNWFANWRRKLKNANVDRNHPTWGHLIRTYNELAQGNVEQFSISSDDSIWSEPDQNGLTDYSSIDADTGSGGSPECAQEYQQDFEESTDPLNNCDKLQNLITNEIPPKEPNLTSPLLLSKWLESAARFQPSETNYSWWADGKRRKIDNKLHLTSQNKISSHGQDEVDAAVALTALASAAVSDYLVGP